MFAKLNQFDAGGADINSQVRTGFSYPEESHA
jgi:hypothetical protein